MGEEIREHCMFLNELSSDTIDIIKTGAEMYEREKDAQRYERMEKDRRERRERALVRNAENKMKKDALDKSIRQALHKMNTTVEAFPFPVDAPEKATDAIIKFLKGTTDGSTNSVKSAHDTFRKEIMAISKQGSYSVKTKDIEAQLIKFKTYVKLIKQAGKVNEPEKGYLDILFNRERRKARMLRQVSYGQNFELFSDFMRQYYEAAQGVAGV